MGDAEVIAKQLAAGTWQQGEIRLVCTEKWQETHDVVSFRFEGTEPVKFNFKPGQFLTFVLDIKGETVYRSYTISSSPSRPYSLVVTVKRIQDGLVSNYLADTLQVGHSVIVNGPSGVFNLVDVPATQKYFFLSAGCGITPMYSMSRWLTDTQVGADIAFVHCARSPEDVIFKSSLERMAQNNQDFKLGYVLEQDAERESNIEQVASGRLNEHTLQQLVPDFKERTVFVCGPEPYMAAMKSMLDELGFNMDNFHQESFGDPALVNAKVAVDQSDSLKGFMMKIGDRMRELKSEQTILDGVEAEGLPMIAACRSGVCGACKCQVVEGEVESTSQMALTPDEIANGFVLACSTKLKSDITLKV